MSISRVAITNIGRWLLSIAVMLAIPMFCIFGSFALYLPQEKITPQDVIQITFSWAPFALEYSVDLIAFVVGLDHSALWIKAGVAATAILLMSGGISWFLDKHLRTGIATSIWIAVTLPLLLIEVVVTSILVQGMILSAGL